MSRSIEIQISDETIYSVDCGLNNLATYGELRTHLVDEEGLEEARTLLLYEEIQVPTEETEALVDQDPIDFSVRKIYLRATQEDERRMEQERLEEEVADDEEEFRGNVSLFVGDPECDTEKMPLEIDADATIGSLMDMYCELARRAKHHDPEDESHVTSVLVREGAEEHALPLHKTLRDCGLTNSGEEPRLIYRAPEYTITIKEKASETPVKLMVYDHWTVAMVKEKYSGMADEGLVEGDSLVLNNQDLDDDKEIYKYQLTCQSVLHVEREDFSTIHFTYMCADCGSDVKLKKEDLVRCRECGYRVVYKKRTLEECQHLAR